MSNASPTILVTGGTGFLGAYILKELVQQGYAVRALRRGKNVPAFIAPHILNQVQWVEGDLLDVVSLDSALQGIDTVIHSAALVSFDPADRHAMNKINIEGTANMVNLSLENQVNRFVYISSVAALGRTPGGDLVTENKKWTNSKLNTHYAISKYFAEKEVWRGMGEGMNVVILNPSTILGYGDWNSSSCAIFRNVYHEFPWYTNGINGFVDVEDVARAAVLLMKSSISNERFIVSGDNWSFRQLMNTIADAFGKKHPHREATPFLSKIAWRLEKFKSLFSGKKPLLTRQSARVAHSKTRFNNRKLLDALPGFTFTPLTITIEKAARQYQSPSTPQPAALPVH